MKPIIRVLLVAIFCVCTANAIGHAQTDAEAILSEMIKARGGPEKMSDVKTSVAKGKMIMVAQGGVPGEITVTSSYPDRVLIEMAIVGVVITQGYDGQIAWVNNPLTGGYQELPPAEAEGMKRDAIGYETLLVPERYGIEYHYRGKETADSGEFHVLEQVYADGTTTTMFIDTESYLLYKTRVDKGSPVQPLVEETFFSDYRDVDGITQAHQTSLFINGQEAVRYLFDQITFNVAVDPAVFQSAAKRFSHEELIADARQLVSIIEQTHPDPYLRMGGKIAFHRHAQQILNAIPAEGMTANEFTALLCPFVAAIKDSHTEIYAYHNVNVVAPGGIPLKFGVVGQSLYVSAVPGDHYLGLLGAILISIEDVPIDVLGQRLRRIKPIDNEYNLLWYFTTTYLWYGPYLKDLLPEWPDAGRLRVKLQLATGETSEVVFDLPMNITSMIGSKSKLVLPSPDESGFVYDFLDSDKHTAYLRIDHMKHYRESFEARNSLGLDSMSQEKLDSIPSVTEFFRSMVKDMKKAGTGAIIVDLRHNIGGDALMADILMYFLHGKSATLDTRWDNVTRLSSIYLGARKSVTLEDLNKERDVPWMEGDYDFSEDYSDDILGDTSALEEGLRHTSTFYQEWQSGEFEGYYCPEKVIVLTRPNIFSAGFGIAVRFYRTDAVLVGTPSGQAPNSGGNAVKWRLDNTGLTGRVSQSYALNFPDESELSRVLPVHYPLTYELLARYNFDPHAEVLYALDLLPEFGEDKR